MTQPAWTYSQLDSFETCPKKFYHLKVAKDFIDPPHESSIWGTRVHEAFEHFILDGTPLPEGMEQWQSFADKLAALKGEKLCEKQLAIDKNFQPADWKQAWSRGIADLIVINGKKALVADYKTGKRKPTEQLELYAAYVFHHYPEVEEVTTMLIWLKDRKIDRDEFKRHEVPDIWQKLLPRTQRLDRAYANDEWPARSSGLCKAWCPVITCKFNGKREKL